MRYLLITCILLMSVFYSMSIWAYAEWETCTWTSCINSVDFEIPVDSIFQTGVKVKWNTSAETSVNYLLGTLIQKLMIGLGSIAAIIMTIGAWYMILNVGQDELLSKWKSIFMSGVISMVVALSSYYLVNLVRYILFNFN